MEKIKRYLGIIVRSIRRGRNLAYHAYEPVLLIRSYFWTDDNHMKGSLSHSQLYNLYEFKELFIDKYNLKDELYFSEETDLIDLFPYRLRVETYYLGFWGDLIPLEDYRKEVRESDIYKAVKGVIEAQGCDENKSNINTLLR